MLAAVTLLAVQGCAPATSSDADAVTAASHSVSFGTAEAVYGSYLAASDTAAAQGDETQGLSMVTAAQWAQVRGQYTDRKSTRLNSSHITPSRMPSSA